MSSGCSGLVNGGLNQGHGTAVGIPRELQEPIFVGANFQLELEVDFWPTFGPGLLCLFLGYFSLPFFRLVIVREMACFIGFSGFETPVLGPF
jgi:hypothetical protein